LVGEEGVFSVAEFVEKPDVERAREYISSGKYLWNSGIFLFSVRLYLEELERLRPDMVRACRQALAASRRDTDFIWLDREAFSAVAGDSIDYAVMEHTKRAGVFPISVGWSDVGSWAALWGVSAKDTYMNAIVGNVVAEDTHNCYLRSEAGLLAVTGVEDLVVAVTDDAVMVAPRDGARQVTKLVERLRRERREEADSPPVVHRPWGSYKRYTTDTGWRSIT
jgi:mannose-1-phosphate guanylyltransferase/mannose-6-phosphate isomerase